MCRIDGFYNGCDFVFQGDQCLNPTEEVFLRAVQQQSCPDDVPISYVFGEESPPNVDPDFVCGYHSGYEEGEENQIFKDLVGDQKAEAAVIALIKRSPDCYALYKNYSFLKRFSEKSEMPFVTFFYFLPARLLENSKSELMSLFEIYRRIEVADLFGAFTSIRHSSPENLKALIDNKDVILHLRSILEDLGKQDNEDERKHRWRQTSPYFPRRPLLAEHKIKFVNYLYRLKKELEESCCTRAYDFSNIYKAFSPTAEDDETWIDRNAGELLDFLVTFKKPSPEFIEDMFKLPSKGLADKLTEVIALVKSFLEDTSSYSLGTSSEIVLDGLARNRDLVKSYFEQLLNISKLLKPKDNTLTEQDLYAAKESFSSTLRNIPRAILGTNPEVVYEIIKKFRKKPEKLGEVFAALAKVTKPEALLLFVKYCDKVEPDQLKLLDYLLVIGFPVEECFSKGKKIENDDLFFDYSDNTDLKDFKAEKKELYEMLINTLSGMYGTLSEEMALSKLTFDTFWGKGKLLPLLEFARAVDDATSGIPKLREILYRDFVRFRVVKEGLLPVVMEWRGTDKKTGLGKIDVTQNNIKDVNTFLRILFYIKKENLVVSNLISTVFPEFKSKGNVESDIIWFVSRFDVEEINFSKITSFDDLADFFELQDQLSQFSEKASVNYLNNKFGEMDIGAIFKESAINARKYLLDIGALESVRKRINSHNRVLGDQLIDQIAAEFLNAYPASDENLPILLDFSKAWDIPQNSTLVEKDVQGLYLQYSNYGFNIIANYLKTEWAEYKNSADRRAEFARRYSAYIKELSAHGIEVVTESDTEKGLSRLLSNPTYVVRRYVEKKFSSDYAVGYQFPNLSFAPGLWPERGGVLVQRILDNGSEAAKVIKVSRSLGGVEILASRTGLVDTEKAVERLGRRYIFSAPMTMTTGVRKMTELVFVGGRQISYLLTPGEKDGILLVSADGTPRILDKREIALKDLISESDLKDPEIRKAVSKWNGGFGKEKMSQQELLNALIYPLQQFPDRNLFMALLKLKKYSLACGMLLINDDEIYRIEDGKTSRRFFVEFNDGTFGVVNSSINMTSSDMVDLSLFAGVRKAIYMDTGMWDKATYRDGYGEDHIIGHSDSVDSTNRVIIFEK